MCTRCGLNPLSPRSRRIYGRSLVIGLCRWKGNLSNDGMVRDFSLARYSKMTNLVAAPTYWSSTGDDDRYRLPAVYVQIVGDCVEVFGIEHQLESPFPSQTVSGKSHDVAIFH